MTFAAFPDSLHHWALVGEDCGVDWAEPRSAELSWYTVDGDVLSRLPQGGRVLHPLPRGPELPTSVDSDPRNVCFRQAANGLYVRMALLSLIDQSSEDPD